ncbi:hypothetical protein NIES4075_50230 [Tolypothrix sp. NIES-4075]|nr:hypothetical protein NIES4075_50230 [Tolypothrix sp. NIES-4075]
MISNYVKKIKLSGAVLWLTQQTLNEEEHPDPTLILHLFT